MSMKVDFRNSSSFSFASFFFVRISSALSNILTIRCCSSMDGQSMSKFPISDKLIEGYDSSLMRVLGEFILSQYIK